MRIFLLKLFIVIGFILLIFPLIMRICFEVNQFKELRVYDDLISKLTEKDLLEIKINEQKHNKKILKLGFLERFNENEKLKKMQQFNNVLGYVQIKKTGLKFPIYFENSENEGGFKIVESSNFPIINGNLLEGESGNLIFKNKDSIFSKIGKNLERIENGAEIIINFLGEERCYEVKELIKDDELNKILLKNETKKNMGTLIVEGMDRLGYEKICVRGIEKKRYDRNKEHFKEILVNLQNTVAATLIAIFVVVIMLFSQFLRMFKKRKRKGILWTRETMLANLENKI